LLRFARNDGRNDDMGTDNLKGQKRGLDAALRATKKPLGRFD
jgi:hypothetical protein